MSNLINRAADYYRRHGLKNSFSRARLGIKRALFDSRMVVFYCDLAKLNPAAVNVPASLRIEWLTDYADLNPHDLQEMTIFWNSKQAHRNIQERFEKGATLWLVKSGDTLAGYGWTIQGRTIEPYYFPLCITDVHLFDFYVFPQYRGHGINPYLVTQILQVLSSESCARAFIEAGEWNRAQLLSLEKTAFIRLGCVKSCSIFGYKWNTWSENSSAQQVQIKIEQAIKIETVANSRE